jgi:hypothetical protein
VADVSMNSGQCAFRTSSQRVALVAINAAVVGVPTGKTKERTEKKSSLVRGHKVVHVVLKIVCSSTEHG